MKRFKTHKSKGQTIILIGIALVGLLGFTALAVDGTMLISSRRNAQSAADAAALAGTYELMVGKNDSVAASRAFALALQEGFNNDGVTNGVEVTIFKGHDDPALADECNGRLLAENTGCVQVDIWNKTQAVFSQVVFTDGLKSEVQSVAKYQRGIFEKGYGMIATANDGSDPALKFSGNPTVYFTGSGAYTDSGMDIVGNVFVDSEAELHGTGACSFNGSVTVLVGGSDYAEEDCDYNPEIILPVFTYPTCPSNVITGNSIAGPGTYTNKITLNASNHVVMSPGLYCFEAGFETNGHATVTGTDVVIYVLGGNFILNGGAENQLYAPLESSPILDGAGEEEYGTLVYLADGVGQANINGNADTGFGGMIYGPNVDCDFNGSGSAMTMDTQIICNTITIGGTAGVAFHLGDGLDIEVPPEMELYQ